MSNYASAKGMQRDFAKVRYKDRRRDKSGKSPVQHIHEGDEGYTFIYEKLDATGQHIVREKQVRFRPVYRIITHPQA